MKWFKHYSNAHDNNDLTKVRMKFGAEGYAIYWYCLELIAGDLGAEDDITFELKHDAEVIGFNLKIDSARVEEVMRFMASLGLFESSAGTITCLKLAKYLDEKTTRNTTMKKIIAASKVDSMERAGYVYFLAAQDADGVTREVKIGRSKNPWARAKDLSRSRESEGYSVALVAHHKTYDSLSLEQALHEVFAEHRRDGEWFAADKSLNHLVISIINGVLRSDEDLLRSATYGDVAELRPPLDTDTDTDRNKKIKGVFAHWRTAFEHPDAVLDDVRQALIAKWLAQGYTDAQLVKAIDGCRKTPWNMGENDAGTVFDDITLIFESAKQIDRFIAHDDNPPKPKQKPARQGGGKGWTFTIAGETIFLPWNDGTHGREYSALQRKFGIDLRGLDRKGCEDKMRRKLGELAGATA